MTGTQTLLARAALGVVGGSASIALTGWRRLSAVSERVFDRAAFAAFALSRLGLFATIFLLLRIAPRGDVPAFYFPQALEALRHRLPYRDFPSSYAPLHPYMDALFVAVRHSPLAIIFAAVLAELLLFSLWLRLGRRLFGETTSRTAALLYLTSPISLQFVAVDGQDNVVIALMIAVALLLALRGRAFLSGVLTGLSAATIKFLPLLYVPAFLVALLRRWRWAGGTAAVLAAVYGGALLLGLPILQPVTAEGAMRSSGNLPYLLEAITGLTLPARVGDAVLLLILGSIAAFIARAVQNESHERRMRLLTFGLVALTLALLLFSKKSWPPYLMMCLFPLCLVVASGLRRPERDSVLFAAFSLAAITEHSVWSSILLEAPSLKLHAALLAGDATAYVFIALHAALLAGYLWLLLQTFARMTGTTPHEPA